MKSEKIKKIFVGTLILSIFLAFGIFILSITGATHIKNYNMLIRYISNHGMEATFATFFIIVGLYGWYKFICNIKLKHKVLYLKEKVTNGYLFLDKRGKKYYYVTEALMDIDEFYEVIKTKNQIEYVVEKSNDTYRIPKERISYWFNFYTPIGNWEKILVLPIAYVFFIPSFLSFIMEEGTNKIYGGALMIIPLLFILYDLGYKIMLNHLKKEDVELKIEKIKDIIHNFTFHIFPLLILLAGYMYVITLLIKFYLQTEILIMQIMVIFLISVVSTAIIAVITKIFKKESIYQFMATMCRIFIRLAVVIFLGFVIYSQFLQYLF